MAKGDDSVGRSPKSFVFHKNFRFHFYLSFPLSFCWQQTHNRSRRETLECSQGSFVRSSIDNDIYLLLFICIKIVGRNGWKNGKLDERNYLFDFLLIDGNILQENGGGIDQKIGLAQTENEVEKMSKWEWMNERLKKDVNRLLYANLWPIIICKFLCCKYVKACNISSKVQDLVGIIKLKINMNPN